MRSTPFTLGKTEVRTDRAMLDALLLHQAGRWNHWNTSRTDRSIKGKALYCFSCVAVKIAVRRAVMVRFCVCQLSLRRLKMTDLENCSCAGSFFFFIVAAKKWRLNFAVVAAVRRNWPSEHWNLHGCSSAQVWHCSPCSRHVPTTKLLSWAEPVPGLPGSSYVHK